MADWTCPHGVTYTGSDDFISGARNAHDEQSEPMTPCYRLDQIVGVKDAARTLPALIERLKRGEGPIVLTRRGKPVAALRAAPSCSTQGYESEDG